MLKLGNGTINKVALGSTEINKVYLGSTVVYESGDPPSEALLDGFEFLDATTTYFDTSERRWARIGGASSSVALTDEDGVTQGEFALLYNRGESGTGFIYDTFEDLSSYSKILIDMTFFDYFSVQISLIDDDDLRTSSTKTPVDLYVPQTYEIIPAPTLNLNNCKVRFITSGSIGDKVVIFDNLRGFV